LLARLVAVAGLALVLAASAVTARQPVVLPRDQAGHPQAGIEWWYFTALVRDKTGDEYSVFFTVFSSRGGLVSVSQVVDLHTGRLVGHTENVGIGLPGTSSLDLAVAGSRLRYVPTSDRWVFAVNSPTFAVTLDQHPLKPYVLHGDHGLIRQSSAGPSHYYSSTRLSATGSLRIGRRNVAVRGQSWFDHQWGDYRDDARAFNWDWFSCRFDDGTELMLYQFLDRLTHRPLASYRTGTFVGLEGGAKHLSTFTATAGRKVLVAAGSRWPLDWTVDVPGLELREQVSSLLPDQLVRNSVLPTFWEGAASASGTKHGVCFVEISYR
jgi:predicted secreted hydrolase